MKKWYHCIQEEPRKVFGFSVIEDIIQDHPDFFWVGKSLSVYKPFLLNNKIKVYEV